MAGASSAAGPAGRSPAASKPRAPRAQELLDRLAGDEKDEFVRRVAAQGVPCTVRDTKGQEIAAACGQLAADEEAS